MKRVRRPGNYEISLGLPTRDLIYELAGGPLPGRSVKAIYPGGSSSPVLTPDEIDLPGIFVKRIVALTPEQAARKDIEKRTTRSRAEGTVK